MCIDPTDDDTIYLLCGCAYFSDAKTEIFRSRDGGETFDRIDVTDLIQVHGNGEGRQFGKRLRLTRTTRTLSTAAVTLLPATLP